MPKFTATSSHQANIPPTKKTLFAVEVPARIDRSQYEKMDVSEEDREEHGRGKRRAARNKAIVYKDESSEDEKVNTPHRINKKRLSQAQVAHFVNRMSRTQLETCVCKLYSSSPDFRATFAHELDKTRLLEPEKVKLPTVNREGLGAFGKIPSEIILEILLLLPFPDRMRMTTAIARALNEFCWVPRLWREIDTSHISFVKLLSVVLPKLEACKCIKDLIVVYQPYMLPKIEKTISKVASCHQLRSFTLDTRHGHFTLKRFETIKTMVATLDGFKNVQHFTLNASFLGLTFPMVTELCESWPLVSFKLVVEANNMWVTLNDVKVLARKPVSGVPGHRQVMSPITPSAAHCWLEFPLSKVDVEDAVLLSLGEHFPELEEGIFYISGLSAARSAIQGSTDFYNVVAPLPRLRTFELGIPICHRGNAEVLVEHTLAASALFFSIIKQAPNLKKFNFLRYSPVRGENLTPVELLVALKHWVQWRGIRNSSLESLTLSHWAIQWNLLTDKNGNKFELPNVSRVNLLNCFNIRDDDPVELMKHGGAFPTEPASAWGNNNNNDDGNNPPASA
ncbi:hypothetical protein FN846DRAFT_1019915 [Sphaerosporella brunnea]|uniref:F-box domain-containing protein n=1 Tax=Sphaerosporella brunnea TaxID=1250544 RepID=A0A5J5F3W5_9PEZI|nr:hypothetical protein FN846DRAFT_1019915 [Sphaerosporella brunnea]